MRADEFETMCNLINQKNDIAHKIDMFLDNISDINAQLIKTVQELFRPFVGRYFRKFNTIHPDLSDIWFMITDVPSNGWMMFGGYVNDEWRVPAKVMGSDGMPKRISVGISPRDFRDNGATLPVYISEVSEDEWFAEQRRRVREEADRKLKEAITD